MRLASWSVSCARFRLMACLAIAVVAESAGVTAMGGQPLPANANYRGKSVAEWSVLQNEYAIASGLGGQTDLSDTVKKVQFLPGAFGGGEFEIEVTVPKGTGIVPPPFFAFGELYEDGTFDDPVALADLLDFIFMNRTVEVRLDGEVVQSGTLDELREYTYGPTFFDAPIPYTEPQDRGPGVPRAVAALWTIGLGGVYHPLPPGEHTFEITTDGPVFGLTHAIYRITVE